MLGWSSETGWRFSFMGALVFILGIGFVIWRSAVRERSLRQREDGWYVWVEWHGGERCSLKHPAEPGGDWDTDGDDGDGD